MTKIGFKMSDETRKRMEAQRKRFETQVIWNKNIDWPSSVKDNISKGMRKYWSEMDDEQRQKMKRMAMLNIVGYNRRSIR
jgi:hypothetical protein